MLPPLAYTATKFQTTKSSFRRDAQSLCVCADKTKSIGRYNYVATIQNALQCDNCCHSCFPFSVKTNQQARPKTPFLLLIGSGVEPPWGRVFAACPCRENKKTKTQFCLSVPDNQSMLPLLVWHAYCRHFQSQFQCVSATIKTEKILTGLWIL